MARVSRRKFLKGLVVLAGVGLAAKTLEWPASSRVTPCVVGTVHPPYEVYKLWTQTDMHGVWTLSRPNVDWH